MFVSHFQSKIKEATSAKSLGTEDFKAKRYPQAIEHYQKALQFVQPHLYYGATEAQFSRSADLKVTLIFNIGLCHFNQKNWRFAEQKFSQAIALNPEYLKALYKRALTREQRNDYEGALADIKQVIQIDKESRQFLDSFQRITRKYNENIRIEPDVKIKLKEKTKASLNGESKKPTIKEKNKETIKNEQDNTKGNKKWWILGLVSIVGIGLYQHFKNQKK